MARSLTLSNIGHDILHRGWLLLVTHSVVPTSEYMYVFICSEYRDNNGVCRPCTIDNCDKCRNATDCLICNSNYTKYHLGCVSECPVDTYTDISAYSANQTECFE